jgi:type III restriction enzyme
MASDEIERFRREITTRTGQQVATDDINEADLLREVMNTVGEKGKLGESIRCVVSVSMLTEGWDANNVTHILGVRAFGTQLLCEQVIGRALRRQSYDLNEKGHFDVEYADVLGIPFNFASESVPAKITPPVERLHVHAVSPDRDHLEINFPRVIGYRVAKPPRKLKAVFAEDDRLVIRAKDVGATDTLNAGIIGAEINLNLEHTGDKLPSRILYTLTSDLIDYKYKDADGYAQGTLFRTLRPIVKEWLNNYLDCREGTYPAQLAFKELSYRACDRINNAITRATNQEQEGRITAMLDPYTPTGSTRFVNFKTTKPGYETRPDLCPVNYAVIDSGWEGEFARIVEKHPKTLRYVKNQALGFEVPYLAAGNQRKYTPDFIVLLDDGHGPDDPLQLIVEVKGYRNEDVKDKSTTMREYWVPGVNALKAYGRWAFAEFQNVETMESEFAERIERELTVILDEFSGAAAGARAS